MAVVPGGDAQQAALNAIAMTAPATSFVAITPNNGADIAIPPRALFIGSDGNIALVGRDDVTNTGVVFAVKAGSVLPFSVRRVLVTGTTVSGVVGLY